MYSQSVHKISMNINPKLPGLKKYVFDVGMEQPWTFLMSEVFYQFTAQAGDTSVVLKYRLKPLDLMVLNLRV